MNKKVAYKILAIIIMLGALFWMLAGLGAWLLDGKEALGSARITLGGVLFLVADYAERRAENQ